MSRGLSLRSEVAFQQVVLGHLSMEESRLWESEMETGHSEELGGDQRPAVCPEVNAEISSKHVLNKYMNDFINRKISTQIHSDL